MHKLIGKSLSHLAKLKRNEFIDIFGLFLRGSYKYLCRQLNEQMTKHTLHTYTHRERQVDERDEEKKILKKIQEKKNI